MKVRDLMMRHVATVKPQDALDLAGRLMNERDCGCVVVVDDERHVLAVLTDRDVCLVAARTDARLSTLRVERAMSSTVVTCSAEDTVGHAQHLMGLHQVRRLPVVDAARRLEGIISLDDIAREARAERRLIAPHVRSASVGRTLGDIDRPYLLGER